MTGYFIVLDGAEYLLHPLPKSQPEPQRTIRIPAEKFENFIETCTVTEEAAWSPRECGSIFIRKNDSYIKISFERILWLEASRSYCTLHLDDGELLVAYPLAETARHLPPAQFLRIHRSYLVNIRHVDSFIGNQVGIGGRKLPIGEQYKEQIAACFDFLKVKKQV